MLEDYSYGEKCSYELGVVSKYGDKFKETFSFPSKLKVQTGLLFPEKNIGHL